MIEREEKYYVFKKEDADFVLQRNPLLQEYFQVICTLIRLHRINHNKRPVNRYVVCNQDESYAEEVWKIILEAEKNKEMKR